MPTSDVHVIIPTGATRYPEISNTGAASKNITINTSATLTINKGYDLTVAGNFKNRGTVTLNSDADEFASLIVQGTSSGNITYKRWVADEGSNEWDLIGSPVAGQTISSFVSANSSLADEGNQYAIGVLVMMDQLIQQLPCIQITPLMELVPQQVSMMLVASIWVKDMQWLLMRQIPLALLLISQEQ